MIRPATEDDAEALATLSGQLGYPTTSSETRERLKEIENRGDGQVFVAETDGTVIGWVHVFGMQVLESSAHAEIGGLVVEELIRGRGVGAQLMSAAEGSGCLDAVCHGAAQEQRDSRGGSPLL